MPHDPLFLATAIEAVLRAGDLQLDSRATRQVGKKGTIDLVTDADIAVEEMVRALITERFPAHQILAEELGGPPRAGAGGHRWLFDPIDGTTNYAHGLPFFCASLALEIGGRVEVAAVYDPSHKELFVAERGQGAFLNGAPLRVSTTEALLDALLCTGFPYDVHETLDEVVGLFRAFVGRARAVRRLGSAALDLCNLAAGRLDGFWEQRLKPWDIAAGALIVEEAGGTLTRFDGSAFDPSGDEILASNTRLHREMQDVIGEFLLARSGKRTH